LLVCASLLLSAAPGKASISVSPSYVLLEAGKGRPSQPISVTNLADKEVRYRIKVVHFSFTETGNVEVVPADAHSLESWIKCNPREFSLAAKSTRAIRLTVVPPKSLGPGEYWAAVWFEPLDSPPDSTADSTAGGKHGQIRIAINILVPIFFDVPRLVFNGELTNVTAARATGGLKLDARLSNTGTGRIKVKGSYEVLDAGGKQVAQGPLGEDTILVGGNRVFSLLARGDFPGREYTVRVGFESAKLGRVLGGQASVRQQ
jgi:hypothetical protein